LGGSKTVGEARLTSAAQLYLDLMKRCLSFAIWGEPLRKYVPPRPRGLRSLLAWLLLQMLERRSKAIYFRPDYDPRFREEGRDHPLLAHTMIGLKRLNNIQDCVMAVLTDGIPGDLIETGVWRGGSVIFMKAILQVCEDNDRIVWVADSFEGLPAPGDKRYPADAGLTFHQMEHLRVSEHEVAANFQAYGLLDQRVRFLKGWFKDTLPSAPIERLSVLRIDGDLYESTMDSLRALYPKVSPGGFVIVDDYGDLPSCRQAVDDYREEMGITETIQWADWSGVYWRKDTSGFGKGRVDSAQPTLAR